MVGALVLAGCQTTAMVRVAVNPDGSGSVVVDVYLDAEAAAQVGDLSKILVMDDLEKAGWKITGPASPARVERILHPDAGPRPSGQPAGTVQIHLAHPFANADEANQILSSLSGPDGPLTDVALSRHASLFRTDLRFTGTVDLSKGLDTFGDVDLTKVLGGSLSDTVAASGTERPSGDDLKIGLQIVPSSDLDWSGEMGNESMGNQTVTASAELGGAPRSLDVHASKVRWGAVVAAAVIVGAVLIGLLGVGVRFRRRANRAERALLPDIEVPDPFVASDVPVDPTARAAVDSRARPPVSARRGEPGDPPNDGSTRPDPSGR